MVAPSPSQSEAAPPAQPLTAAELKLQLEKRLAAGQAAGTVPAAEALVQATPDDPKAWTILGVALRSNGQPGSAIVAYRRALALDPDQGGVLSNLGNALKDVGRLDEVVVHREQRVPDLARLGIGFEPVGLRLPPVEADGLGGHGRAA